MSSHVPRQSVDKHGSPFTSPSQTQYPFPPTEPQRPGSSGRYSGRRSTAGSVTSIGGFLDTSTQGSDSLAEAGSNAIATLLQPPIVRTGLASHTTAANAQKLPTAKDIPPVALTNIPHIEPSVFTPYLKQAGSLYDAFQRAREDEGSRPTYFKRSRTSSKSEQASSTFTYRHQARQSVSSSTQSPDSLLSPVTSPAEKPKPRRTASGGPSRRGPPPVAPLSTIPSVYFEHDFHLENPRTFDIVSERSEIVRPPPGSNGPASTPVHGGRKALATNAILQEKLSWYMDTVEVHLISSISTASSSFFAALGSLRDLHLEAATSVAKIKGLRADLAAVDRNMAAGGMKIVALRRRKENMRKLGDAVEQLREVMEAIARCEDQVDKGAIEEALQGLDGVEHLIAGERIHSTLSKPQGSAVYSEKLVDLRGVKVLESVSNDIAYLRQRIGRNFEARFLETLLADLRHHVDSTSPNTTFQRWDKASQRSRGTHARTPSIFPAYLHVDDSLRQDLRSNLEGLAQSDWVKTATTAYREAVWKETKTLIRRHLPSSSDDDAESTLSASTHSGRHMSSQEKSAIIARNVRSLEPEDAEDMFKKIYSNVGEALRRLGTQVKVILDITSTLDSTPASKGIQSPMSPPVKNMDSYMRLSSPNQAERASVQQDDIQQTLDMSNLLGQAVDIAQGQITKLLKVRSEQSIGLSLPQFLRYFQLNKLFADECEAVSGRGGIALKTVVDAHIKDFVGHALDLERQRLLDAMDSDRWDVKDFTDNDEQMLSQVIEASTREVESWTKASMVWADGASSTNGDHMQGSTLSNGTSQKDKTRSAIIDEQKFILVYSALTVLKGVSQFEQLITGIPNMTQEITVSLLEYLRLFNSRSSQLILGAGATRAVGLKNITTKHLALASQALSFVIALIPYVREFVRKHSPGAGSLMAEFDKVKRLYQEHQAGINDKMVDIMSSRAAVHVNAMKKIDWDSTSSNQAVNPYMESLVKETTTLHKTISRHLPEVAVSMVMHPVFASFREQLGQAFQDVDVKTIAGKERMLRDAEDFKSRMSKIDGAADVGDYFVKIVNDKVVTENPKTLPPPQPSPPPADPIGPETSSEKPQENGVGEKT